MKIEEAIQMISNGRFETNYPSVWTDLGCGSGLFTRALSSLLAEGSKIYAVDEQYQQIRNYKNPTVEIAFVQANFEKSLLPFNKLDGLLMANSLHYIRDKSSFLIQMQRHCKQESELIIIEYDTERGNPWVPFPIPKKRLEKLLTDLGYRDIVTLGERPSVYGNGQIYALAGTLEV